MEREFGYTELQIRNVIDRVLVRCCVRTCQSFSIAINSGSYNICIYDIITINIYTYMYVVYKQLIFNISGCVARLFAVINDLLDKCENNFEHNKKL